MIVIIICILVTCMMKQVRVDGRISMNMTMGEIEILNFQCNPILNSTALTIDWDNNLLVQQSLQLQIANESIHVTKDYIRIVDQCLSFIYLRCQTNHCKFTIYQDGFKILQNTAYQVTQLFNTFTYIKLSVEVDIVGIFKVENIVQTDIHFQVFYNLNNKLPTYNEYEQQCLSYQVGEVLCHLRTGLYSILVHAALNSKWSLFKFNTVDNMKSQQEINRQFFHKQANEVQKIKSSIIRLENDLAMKIKIKIIYGELKFQLEYRTLNLKNTQSVRQFAISTMSSSFEIEAVTEALFLLEDVQAIPIQMDQNMILYIDGPVESVPISSIESILTPTSFDMTINNCTTHELDLVGSQPGSRNNQPHQNYKLINLNFNTSFTTNTCVVTFSEPSAPIVISEPQSQIYQMESNHTISFQDNLKVQLKILQGNCTVDVLNKTMSISITGFTVIRIDATYLADNRVFTQLYMGINCLAKESKYLKLYVESGIEIELITSDMITFNCYFDSEFKQDIKTKVIRFPDDVQEGYIYIEIRIPQDFQNNAYMLQVKNARLFKRYSQRTLINDNTRIAQLTYQFTNNLNLLTQPIQHIISIHGFQNNCSIKSINKDVIDANFWITNSQNEYNEFQLQHCDDQFIVLIMDKYIGQQVLIQDQIYQMQNDYLYLVSLHNKQIIIQCNQLQQQFYVTYQQPSTEFGYYPTSDYYHDILDFSKSNTIRLKINTTFCELLLCVIRLTRLQTIQHDPILISYSRHLILVDSDSHIHTHTDIEFYIISQSQSEIYCLASPVIGEIHQIITDGKIILQNHWLLQLNDIISIQCLNQCSLMILCSYQLNFTLNDYPLLLFGVSQQSIRFVAQNRIDIQIISGTPVISTINTLVVDLLLGQQSSLIINQWNSKVILVMDQIYQSYGTTDVQIIMNTISDIYINICVTNGIVELQNNASTFTINALQQTKCQQLYIKFAGNQEIMLIMRQNSEYQSLYYRLDKSMELRINQLNMLSIGQPAQFKQLGSNKIIFESNAQFELYQNANKLHPLNTKTTRNTYSKIYQIEEYSIVNVFSQHVSNSGRAIQLSIQLEQQPRQLFHNFTMTSFELTTQWLLTPQLNHFHILQFQSDEDFSLNVNNSFTSNLKFAQIFINESDSPLLMTTNCISTVYTQVYSVQVQHYECYHEIYEVIITQEGNTYQITLPETIPKPYCQLLFIEIQIGDTTYNINPNVTSFQIPNHQQPQESESSVICNYIFNLVTYLTNKQYIKLQYFPSFHHEVKYNKEASNYSIIFTIIGLAILIILIILMVKCHRLIYKQHQITVVQHIEMQQDLAY